MNGIAVQEGGLRDEAQMEWPRKIGNPCGLRQLPLRKGADNGCMDLLYQRFGLRKGTKMQQDMNTETPTTAAGYFKEDGKTWYHYGGDSGLIYRAHDENFSGMRFKHRRCPFCQRITSCATLHWLTHVEKCAPVGKYRSSQLLKMRHTPINEIVSYD